MDNTQRISQIENESSDLLVFLKNEELIKPIEEKFILRALGVNNLGEIEGVSTEDNYELFNWMYCIIKDYPSNVIGVNGFMVMLTPIGKILYEFEEGGYYAIHWKKGSLKWSKIL